MPRKSSPRVWWSSIAPPEDLRCTPLPTQDSGPSANFSTHLAGSPRGRHATATPRLDPQFPRPSEDLVSAGAPPAPHPNVMGQPCTEYMRMTECSWRKFPKLRLSPPCARGEIVTRGRELVVVSLFPRRISMIDAQTMSVTSGTGNPCRGGRSAHSRQPGQNGRIGSDGRRAILTPRRLCRRWDLMAGAPARVSHLPKRGGRRAFHPVLLPVQCAGAHHEPRSVRGGDFAVQQPRELVSPGGTGTRSASVQARRRW